MLTDQELQSLREAAADELERMRLDAKLRNMQRSGSKSDLTVMCAEAADALTELMEWRKLRDPVTLHVSLLRGFPSQLDRATFLHIAGDDTLHMHPDLVAKLPP